MPKLPTLKPAATVITITREQMLEIELAVTKIALFEAQLAQMVQKRRELQAAKIKALDNAGVNPTLQYQLDTTALTLTLMNPAPPE